MKLEKKRSYHPRGSCMSKRPDEAYLQDILDSIHLILEFIKEYDFEMFQNDKKTYSAVIRQLEIIGEASNKLSKEFKTQKPDIPWKEIIGMRNMLIHVYHDIDSREIWKTLNEDVPVLLEKLK